MALVGKTGSKSDLTCRHRRRGQQGSCVFDAAADHILMYGRSGTVAKECLQTSRADTGNRCKIGQMKFLVKVGFDELGQRSQLSLRHPRSAETFRMQGAI